MHPHPHPQWGMGNPDLGTSRWHIPWKLNNSRRYGLEMNVYSIFQKLQVFFINLIILFYNVENYQMYILITEKFRKHFRFLSQVSPRKGNDQEIWLIFYSTMTFQRRNPNIIMNNLIWKRNIRFRQIKWQFNMFAKLTSMTQ